MANKVTPLASDIIGELKKVSWPSREDTIRLTAIVVFISLIIAIYIGIIDTLLALGLDYLTKMQ